MIIFGKFKPHHSMRSAMHYFIIFTLVIILLAACTSTPVGAATYYIDPTCSSNGDGTTTTCGTHGPFKTWAKVPWVAGNTYSQKGGTVTNETITIGTTGTPGKIITLNSYGTGKAKLDGGVTIPSDKWIDQAGGIYKSTYKPQGMGTGQLGAAVIEDGIVIKSAYKEKNTSIVQAFACTGKGTPTVGCSSDATGAKNLYDRFTSVNYYKPSSGTPSAHEIKRPNSYAINIGSKSYITITGFDITNYNYGVYGVAIKGTANNYITVTDNNIHNMFSGIWFELWDANSTGIVITNNGIDYVRMAIELQIHGDCNRSAGGATGDFDKVTVANNTITNGNWIEGAGKSYTWESVNLLNWDEEGIGFQSLTNSNIYNNKITGNIRGIIQFVCEKTNCTNNNYYNNYIKTDRIPFYFQPALSKTASPVNISGNKIYNNILQMSGISGYGAPFVANGIPSPPTDTYNKFYNNTLIPFHSAKPAYSNGIMFLDYADYWEIKNNIFFNIGNHYIYHKDNPTPTHMVYDHNLYNNFVTWTNWYINGGTKSYTQWKALGENYDAHSPAPAKPLFRNAGGGDYTPTAISPAKWKGVSVGLNTDYAGNPTHNPPSIGAIEYVTPSTPNNLQHK